MNKTNCQALLTDFLVRLNQKKGAIRRAPAIGPLEVLDVSMEDLRLITRSGGGDIYSSTWRERNHVFKILNTAGHVTVPMQLVHIQQKAREFQELAQVPGLVVPLALFRINRTIRGYIMLSVPNAQTLNNKCASAQNFDVVSLIKDITRKFQAIKALNLNPKIEHGGNILVDQANNIYLIDLDELDEPYESDRSVIEQLSTVFMSCKHKTNWRRIFESRGANEFVKENFQNFSDLLDL